MQLLKVSQSEQKTNDNKDKFTIYVVQFNTTAQQSAAYK